MEKIDYLKSDIKKSGLLALIIFILFAVLYYLDSSSGFLSKIF